MELSQSALPDVAAHREWRARGTACAEAQHVLSADDPERPGLQRFIADAYLRAYGARVGHFAQQLVGLRRTDGPWQAGVGYTPAGRDPLFVEQYLDRPVEAEIAARIGLPVRREQVVEVGNLAASRAGAARRIIVCTAALLHRLDRTWVVFTSTRSLLNSFTRLDIAPITLAQADPARLADHGESWGNYYDTNPQVMIANIPLGFRILHTGRARIAA